MSRNMMLPVVTETVLSHVTSASPTGRRYLPFHQRLSAAKNQQRTSVSIVPVSRETDVQGRTEGSG